MKNEHVAWGLAILVLIGMRIFAGALADHPGHDHLVAAINEIVDAGKVVGIVMFLGLVWRML